MMKNFVYQNDPIYVKPNTHGSGLIVKLQNKMGLAWKAEAEFYGRRSEIQEARPGQFIDDLLMPYVNEFPNIPEFPVINAATQPMPMLQILEQPMQVEIPQQPPQVEQNFGQIMEQIPIIGNMSADNNQNPNPQVQQPQPDVVPIEPIPLAELPLNEDIQLIDEILQENEDRNIQLMFVEEQNLDQLLN